MKNPHKQGFTLIEMSVVLVIIGLIVGGILVGQSLIYQAMLRSVITQEQKLQSAITTFRGKYDCLPGDCPNATTFGFTSPNSAQVVANGNGDGIIGPTNGSLFVYPGALDPAPDNEPVMFWVELSQAGYIAGYQYNGWQAHHGR